MRANGDWGGLLMIDRYSKNKRVGGCDEVVDPYWGWKVM